MRRAARIPALAPMCLCSAVTLPCVVAPALNVDSTTPMNRSFVGRLFSMGLLLVLLLLTQAAVIPSASAQSLYVGNGSSNQTVNITSGVNNYIETLISVTPTDSNNLLSVSNDGTYLSVTLDLYVGFAGSGSMTISSGARVQNRSCNIGNNTGSMGSVTASGGLWTNFSSLYVGKSGSGSMTVSGGRVISNSDASIGADNSSTGSVMVSDGSWSNGGNLFVGNRGSGSMSITGGVVEASSGWIGLNPGSSNSSVVVSGGLWANSGILVVGNDSSGSMTISGGTATNTDGYIGNGTSGTGSVTVSSGRWSNSGGLIVGQGGSGSLTISASGTVDASTVTLANNGSSTGTLNIGSVGGSNTAGTLSTATIGFGSGTGTINFNQTNSFTLSAVISGSGRVNQLGVGTTILSGTNTYTGATNVAAGRLSVNGVLGTTPVAVLAAAELGGSGSIGGPVSIASGGTLSPGDSIASLATGTATFAAAATFAYEVDSTNLGALGTAADLLVVTGDLNLDPGNGTLLTFTDLNLTPQAFLPNTIFALINYSGAWNGGLFTYAGNVLADGGTFTVGGQQWTIDYDLASSAGLANFVGDYLPASRFVAITAVTPVPEPTTYAMALAGIACGGFSMWRRRKRA